MQARSDRLKFRQSLSMRGGEFTGSSWRRWLASRWSIFGMVAKRTRRLASRRIYTLGSRNCPQAAAASAMPRSPRENCCSTASQNNSSTKQKQCQPFKMPVLHCSSQISSAEGRRPDAAACATGRRSESYSFPLYHYFCSQACLLSHEAVY